jgi:hypothetical protein
MLAAPETMYPSGSNRVSYCEECPVDSECAHRDSITTVKNGYMSPQGTSIPIICPAGWECLHGTGDIWNYVDLALKSGTGEYS